MKEKELKEISNAFQQTTGGKWVSHEKFPGSIAREFEIRSDTGGTLFRSTSYGNMDRDAAFIELSHDKMPKLIAEVESLRSGYLTDEHGNEYVQVCILKEKIREQEAEIERLRDALIPFASLGGPNDGMKAFHDLEDDIVIFENSGKSITAGDVRKARASLS